MPDEYLSTKNLSLVKSIEVQYYILIKPLKSKQAQNYIDKYLPRNHEKACC